MLKGNDQLVYLIFLNKGCDTQLKGRRAADEREPPSKYRVELCDGFSKQQYSEGERLKTDSELEGEGRSCWC